MADQARHASPEKALPASPGRVRVPRRRSSMRQIGEVLRLKSRGMNNREIARSTGLGKTTVYEYLARAEAAGLSWPLPAALDDAALEARLFPPATAELGDDRPVPDWRQVHRELKRGHHVTLRLLWMEWRQDHPDGWGYSQFCDHYQRWLGEQDLVLRLEYAAGERMFVDFSGDRMPVTDPMTGEVSQFEIFVAVLGASGMLYVEATRGQDLKSWLLAHARAYQAYGGVSRVTVPDNLKSGVTRACWYDPEVNPSYLELARHFNTVILPTRTAKPRDKAAVEAGVLVVERWVLAPLRNQRFFSGGELNLAIGREVAKVNGREFRGQPTSRRDLFLEIERPAMQPLPPSRFEFTEIKKATANIDYHVEFDHRFYSVPYQLVRQRVEVWATATTIEIYHCNRRVASHVREHGYRACLGLMSLAKRYTPNRVAAACERALAMNAVSYTSVKSILAQNLDRLPLPSVQLSLVPPPPAHENLRGADYYRAEREA